MIDLALSSYWMRGRYERIGDFFRVGAELGLSAFEVSGLHIDTFYQDVRPGHFNIVSFHNPAPPQRGETVMGSQAARRADVVLTSLDGERRGQAVAAVKQCLDVASEFGARASVLHLGNTRAEPALEQQLKHVTLARRGAGPEAESLRSRVLTERSLGRAERMDALRRSLDELIPYAASRGVRLGLENRPICQVPNFEDMGEILSWYADDAEAVGYWHDTGHAQVQEALGFTPQADWLRAYGQRLVGTHLHDEIEFGVHRAPGAGHVDWGRLASLLPPDALRVIEVDQTVTTQALRAGILCLGATGWLTSLT